MGLKRRAFLQRAAALGLSEASFGLLSQRYGQALAAPLADRQSRKLALLVGINQYPESVCGYAPKASALSGCLTDVELQYELLVNRFGFVPADIRVLADQAATRDGIEAAFLEHLVQQATPGDLVLFHFSGLGSQVQLEGGSQTSLVPIDGFLPTADSPVVQDLMEETLNLLLRSLPTRQVITLLDLGHSQLGRSSQGNLRIRSRPSTVAGAVAESELAFQAGLRAGRLARSWPGLLLRAAAAGQRVAEAQWSGFSAGLFTYALTQQLWGESSLMVSFSRATALVQQMPGAEQQPTAAGLAPSLWQAEPSAVGVIREIDSEGGLSLWLAGLPSAVLEAQTASLLALAPEAQPEPALLQLRSRDGLTAKARGLSPGWRPGQLVREAVRILPRNLSLTVLLDPNLERIERVDAISAFAAIPRISIATTSDLAIDLLFGKPLPALADAVEPEPAPPSGYGLFYPSRSVVPGSLNLAAEAVKTAVTRLMPQLKAFLAIKLLRLTQNSGASKLAVRATLNLAAPEPQQLQYVLQNDSTRPVYFLLVGLNAQGTAMMLYPAEPTVAAGETMLLSSVNGARLQQPAISLAETYLIFSAAPFHQTHQLYAKSPQLEPDRLSAVNNPLEVVEAILQDLDQASAVRSAGLAAEIPADSYALDMSAWSSFSVRDQAVG